MKKRIKVFASGNYPQGDFSEERVSKIFSKANKVDGIFAHTSKWEEKGEQPLNIGEFSNFKVEKGVVTADVEFNADGDKYFNDGVIRGVSVEIRNDELSKVALLPIGVKPAVAGAEFQEVIEFEEVVVTSTKTNDDETVTLEKVLTFVKNAELGIRTQVINAIFGSLTIEEREGIRQLYWADFEKKTVKKSKTEEEIRAEIVKEFEDKAKTDNLKAVAKRKFIPCMQEIVEFAIDKAIQENKIVEFEENGEKKSLLFFEKLEKDINSMKDVVNFSSKIENLEFGNVEAKSVMQKSFENTKNILGGKK